MFKYSSFNRTYLREDPSIYKCSCFERPNTKSQYFIKKNGIQQLVLPYQPISINNQQRQASKANASKGFTKISLRRQKQKTITKVPPKVMHTVNKIIIPKADPGFNSATVGFGGNIYQLKAGQGPLLQKTVTFNQYNKLYHVRQPVMPMRRIVSCQKLELYPQQTLFSNTLEPPPKRAPIIQFAKNGTSGPINCGNSYDNHSRIQTLTLAQERSNVTSSFYLSEMQKDVTSEIAPETEAKSLRMKKEVEITNYLLLGGKPDSIFERQERSFIKEMRHNRSFASMEEERSMGFQIDRSHISETVRSNIALKKRVERRVITKMQDMQEIESHPDDNEVIDDDKESVVLGRLNQYSDVSLVEPQIQTTSPFSKSGNTQSSTIVNPSKEFDAAIGRLTLRARASTKYGNY